MGLVLDEILQGCGALTAFVPDNTSDRNVDGLSLMFPFRLLLTLKIIPAGNHIANSSRLNRGIPFPKRKVLEENNAAIMPVPVVGILF